MKLFDLFPRSQRQGVSSLVRWSPACGAIYPRHTVLMRIRHAHLPPVLLKNDITEINQMQKGKFNTSVNELYFKFRDSSQKPVVIQVRNKIGYLFWRPPSVTSSRIAEAASL
ncbi:hypothetical protein EVAR_25743_1 [Eumeta japonica]|uniref:Uncharacterized protein n=1 Tax=Eumeta variegata TaxID=151549 RepID=A0A4C1V7R7_EUMVA|nr:hypothetical protein EVAR_25743_1 [Eumeta japonica]